MGPLCVANQRSTLPSTMATRLVPSGEILTAFIGGPPSLNAMISIPDATSIECKLPLAHPAYISRSSGETAILLGMMSAGITMSVSEMRDQSAVDQTEATWVCEFPF